ncbi:MAG TPA: DAK2 domain-containing protein [Trueperaceae bacterium]|nr:DAK2 domain-containing protein [Trueperaceae bacterium]
MPEAAKPEQQQDAFSARELSRAFIFATQWLGVFVEEVNALNVYPVPDGDTGTNMHLTMQSVRRQLSELRTVNMTGVAHALSYGSLLGARGNSGVILSQVLKGFAEAIKEFDRLQGEDVADALVSGSATAYAAVMKPVEGTILTVVREAGEAANNAKHLAPVEVLNRALEAGRVALERTPELLPVLKQAGVVDAGGLGVLRLLEGVIGYFEGRDLPPPPKIEKRAQLQFEEEEFGFCTEFLLADVEVPTKEIQQLVAPFGDSLLVVGAEGFVKGHIHTQEPEKLLAEVGRYGRMVRSKVEDMSEQHSEILADVDLADGEGPTSAAVAVASGYGLTKVFRSLGVRVVGGGQTDNPSVQDIADAVRSVGAKSVIVMPNNKNVIMAAERVAELVPEKDVTVVPTKTLGQGLAAAVSFNESLPAEVLVDEMRAAAEGTVTLEVTSASREAEIEGVTVSEGQAIGLVDGVLAAAAHSYEEALLALLPERAPEHDIASLFHSAEVSGERARAVVERIAKAYPGLEVELHSGAPDLYAFLMVLE